MFLNNLLMNKIKKPIINTELPPNEELKTKFEILRKMNEKTNNDTNSRETTNNYSFLVKKSPKLQILIDKHLIDKQKEEQISCYSLCYAIYLVFKNFGLKMQDHLLLGGEHTQKIWPSALSPKSRQSLSPRELKEMSPEDKKDIVLNDPKFGMLVYSNII